VKNKSFWQTLAKPIVGLAPMDGVSDQPFRFIQKKYGKPDLVFTEFVSVEGLCHSAEMLLDHLLYDSSQKPIVAQLYGKTPDFFRQAATLVCQLGFDGIDINMGCPAKNVAAHGSGAALIQTPKLAQAIISATKLGVIDWQNGKSASDCPDFSARIISQVKPRIKSIKVDRKKVLPVSIKTRIGYSSPKIETWLPILLETLPAAVTIHGRTLKQGYSGQADWEEIARGAAVPRAADTLILGNGDIQSRSQALEYAKKYQVDGILIGRASFGNPYVFRSEDDKVSISLPQIALEHALIFEKTFSQKAKYSFLPMRKHLGWYIRGQNKAKEIRTALMNSQNSTDVEKILKRYSLI